MPVSLNNAQRRYLKSLAHPLRPVIQIGGKGLTDAVIAELDIALEHHELVKVKIAADDREARDAIVDTLAGRSDAALVQRVGNIATLYRRSRDKPQIVLPRG